MTFDYESVKAVPGLDRHEWGGFEHTLANVACAKKHHREIRADLKLAFQIGLSVRKAAYLASCSKVTAGKWFKVFRARYGQPLCGCGQSAKHNGWCRYRYERSDRRQAFMKAWGERRGRCVAKAA